jgi:hypothetical protein
VEISGLAIVVHPTIAVVVGFIVVGEGWTTAQHVLDQLWIEEDGGDSKPPTINYFQPPPKSIVFRCQECATEPNWN